MALQILYVYKLAIQWKSAQLLSVGIVLVPKVAGFFALASKSFDYIHTWLQLGGRWHARWSWLGFSKNMIRFGSWFYMIQYRGVVPFTLTYADATEWRSILIEVLCIVGDCRHIIFDSFVYWSSLRSSFQFFTTHDQSIEADAPSPLRKPRWRRRLWRNAASSCEWHHKDLQISKCLWSLWSIAMSFFRKVFSKLSEAMSWSTLNILGWPSTTGVGGGDQSCGQLFRWEQKSIGKQRTVPICRLKIMDLNLLSHVFSIRFLSRCQLGWSTCEAWKRCMVEALYTGGNHMRLPGQGLRWCTNKTMNFSLTSFQWISFFSSMALLQ